MPRRYAPRNDIAYLKGIASKHPSIVADLERGFVPAANVFDGDRPPPVGRFDHTEIEVVDGGEVLP